MTLWQQLQQGNSRLNLKSSLDVTRDIKEMLKSHIPPNLGLVEDVVEENGSC